MAKFPIVDLTKDDPSPPVIDGAEARDLPPGSVLLPCDVHGQPFPLGTAGGRPFRVSERNASVFYDSSYLLLYRAPAPQPKRWREKDVIAGSGVPNLPVGTRYTTADADDQPAEYGVIFQVLDGYVPGAVEPDDAYVLLYVPEGD